MPISYDMPRRAALCIFLILTLLPAACGGGAAPAATLPSVDVSPATAVPSPTPFIVNVPDDIPLLPDATGLRGTQSQAEYASEYTVADAIAFYTPELEGLGWKTLGQPNVFGNVAGLTYGKDGKYLTVQLQYNELSLSLKVTLSWSGY